MNAKYTSRNEAIVAEILDPIEATGEVGDAAVHYDIDAIADAVLGDYQDGYTVTVDHDEFWEIVSQNAR